MGEVTPQLVVTALFSEGCDACVTMDPIIREFGRNHEDIPVFISYSEKIMDDYEIEATPAILFTFMNDPRHYISEGIQNVSEIEQHIDEIFEHLSYND